MTDTQYDSAYSNQIELLEKEIIEEVFNSPLFSFRSTYINRIIAYFVTRRNLTQNQLRELTDFSAGEISQDLNQLKMQGIIRVADKNVKGEILYEMESLKTVIFNRATGLFSTLINHEDKFNTIKFEMEEDASLKNLNGYENIYEVVDYYLGVIPGYKILLSKFKSFIDQIYEEK